MDYKYQIVNIKYQILNIKGTFLVILVCAIISALLSSCMFYSFKGTLPPHIKNVAIPIFNDRTAEFNIQQTVTDQIRLNIIQENILKLASEDNCHSILYGTILSIGDEPLIYTETETGEEVKEYRLTLRIEVEWYDSINNKSIFKKEFVGYSEYDPSALDGSTREKALENAIDQITEDIINSLLSGW